MLFLWVQFNRLFCSNFATEKEKNDYKGYEISYFRNFGLRDQMMNKKAINFS